MDRQNVIEIYKCTHGVCSVSSGDRTYYIKQLSENEERQKHL